MSGHRSLETPGTLILRMEETRSAIDQHCLAVLNRRDLIPGTPSLNDLNSLEVLNQREFPSRIAGKENTRPGTTSLKDHHLLEIFRPRVMRGPSIIVAAAVNQQFETMLCAYKEGVKVATGGYPKHGNEISEGWRTTLFLSHRICSLSFSLSITITTNGIISTTVAKRCCAHTKKESKWQREGTQSTATRSLRDGELPSSCRTIFALSFSLSITHHHKWYHQHYSSETMLCAYKEGVKVTMGGYPKHGNEISEGWRTTLFLSHRICSLSFSLSITITTNGIISTTVACYH
mmetsp:Transcript_19946/g.49006  ORF Transcript_19946/g.49006 Transcript_19946/m.49006 type:complete len:290 (+) Transcript_19946:1306-2175(+)